MSSFKMSSDELMLCSARPLPDITQPCTQGPPHTPLTCHYCAGLEVTGGNELNEFVASKMGLQVAQRVGNINSSPCCSLSVNLGFLCGHCI